MPRPFRTLYAHHRHIIGHVFKSAVELVILKDVPDVRQRMLDDCTANRQVETFFTCPQVNV